MELHQIKRIFGLKFQCSESDALHPCLEVSWNGSEKSGGEGATSPILKDEFKPTKQISSMRKC